MTVSGRILLVAALAVPSASLSQTASAAPTKSVKDCNKELDKQRDALEAAGDTPQAFFHRCWWESKLGEPTPLKSAKAATGPQRATGNPAPERARTAKAALKRVEPRAGPSRWRAGSRRVTGAADAPPDPAFEGPPPPLLLAERPPPPIYRPLPRLCLNLGLITAGVVRGRPCVPVPVGPGLDVP